MGSVMQNFYCNYRTWGKLNMLGLVPFCFVEVGNYTDYQENQH